MVEDGDIIHVDLNQNMIHLQISDEELEKRRANFKPLVRVAEKGLLGRYAKLVQSAKTGAVLK